MNKIFENREEPCGCCKGEMNPRERLGRRVILVVGVLTVLISISVITEVLMKVGLSRETVTPRAIRLGLTVLIVFAMVRGYQWAKMLLAVLFLFGGVFSLIAGLAALVDGGGVRLLALGLFYLASGLLLLCLPQVREYQAFRKSLGGR